MGCRRLPAPKAQRLVDSGRYVAVMQTFYGEERLVAVPTGGPEHTAALAGVDGWSLPPLADYSHDAAMFADVAHDNAGMVGIYDLLEAQAEAWAASMPPNTPRQEARRYMLACVDALAERMRDMVEGIMLDDIALPWGEECDECDDAPNAGGDE